MLQLETEALHKYVSVAEREAFQAELEVAHQTVLNGSGAGNDMLGWRDLLHEPNDALLSDLESTAQRIRASADVLVCIGIGGSYLGAKAVIEALLPYFDRSGPEVLFAGHHISGVYLKQLLDSLEGKSVYINVISKSGTTLEPALAFRVLRSWLEARFLDADDRIIITTDPERGALNELKRQHAYKKYEIPPSVGGRFSVLTPVGLLPIAVAGIDIRSLFYGAVSAYRDMQTVDANPALDYAAYRYLLLKKGYLAEVFAVLEPRLFPFGGWWQQLFGESEGKQHTGLFPVAVQYSTDLHSLGQFMQEGQRIVMETFLMLKQDGGETFQVPGMPQNLDGLNYLTGQSFQFINRKAYEGTQKAHTDGGVPTLTVWLDSLSAASLGYCIYFFEHAVAVGGYLLEINPFDQPGVEAYKTEMFRLLGRPGK